jgi:hypothetical protein
MLGARFRSNEQNDLKRKSIVTSLGGSARGLILMATGPDCFGSPQLNNIFTGMMPATHRRNRSLGRVS